MSKNINEQLLLYGRGGTSSKHGGIPQVVIQHVGQPTPQISLNIFAGTFPKLNLYKKSQFKTKKLLSCLSNFYGLVLLVGNSLPDMCLISLSNKES